MAVMTRGIISRQLKGHKFEVALQDIPEHSVQAVLCGKMRLARITVIAGDEVDLELSEYDLEKGRIIWRYNT